MDWLIREEWDLVEELDWGVEKSELLEDYFGVRFEGLTSVTLNDYKNFLTVKVYQKPDRVRRESVINRTHTPQILTAFMSGGLPDANFMKCLVDIQAEIRTMKIAQKMEFGKLSEIFEYFRKVGVS